MNQINYSNLKSYLTDPNFVNKLEAQLQKKIDLNKTLFDKEVQDAIATMIASTGGLLNWESITTEEKLKSKPELYKSIKNTKLVEDIIKKKEK